MPETEDAVNRARPLSYDAPPFASAKLAGSDATLLRHEGADGGSP